MPDAVTASVTRRPGGGDVTVQAADIGQELTGETFAFDRRGPVEAHRREAAWRPDPRR